MDHILNQLIYLVIYILPYRWFQRQIDSLVFQARELKIEIEHFCVSQGFEVFEKLQKTLSVLEAYTLHIICNYLTQRKR